MSAPSPDWLPSSASPTASRRFTSADGLLSPRSLALAGLIVMTAGYCTTLYWVTTVGGGSAWLAGSIALGIVAGVALRDTGERRVLRIAGVSAVAAAGLYYATAAPSIDANAVAVAVVDGLSMVSGITVLRLAAVDVWIAAIVPIPVFLSTYLGLRGRYTAATVAGGWLVCFLALTGDATVLETLVGAVGAVAAVGFGELDRRGGTVDGVNVLVVLLAVMAVLAVAVPMVPSGSASQLDPAGVDADATVGEGGTAEPVPLDEQLLSGDAVGAGGPINLSSDVRFVVGSESRQRYRLDALDTYDGERWYRSGSSKPFMNALRGPPGERETVRQEFDLRTEASDVPTTSYPVAVDGLPANSLRVTSTGALSVDGRLPAGTNYTIRNGVPDPSASDLQTAGTDYPASVERRYTRLPNDTVPERVANLTDQVTAETTTPYGTASAIESYLEDNKEYSQNVSPPSGTTTDGFLFEMDAGYCTYFASSMATMLRTQDVPARVVVGYNGGQWAGNDTWVVRGTDAHAWVEVYFPDVGWVPFDPTPSGPVQDARQDAIESARANGTDRVDVPESVGEEVRFDRPPEETAGDDGNDTDGNGTDDGNGSDPTNQSNVGSSGNPGNTAYSGLPYNPGNVSVSTAGYVEPDIQANLGANDTEANESADESADPRSGRRLLDGLDTTVLGVLLVAGTVAGSHRAGVPGRLRRVGGVVWQRRRDPESDVERAIERLEDWLAREYDPRRPGETHREYRRRLPEAVDPAVGRAYEIHERARYGGEIDRETADELVGLVDGLVRGSVPVLRRFAR